MFGPLLQAVIAYVSVGFAQCWSLSGPRAASTPSTGTFLMARHDQSRVVSSRVFYSALYWSWVGSRHKGAYPDDEWIPGMRDENDDERDGLTAGSTSISVSSDWIEAELTLRSSPNHPNPYLLPHHVATICCRSLQWIDYPAVDAGLRRCYRFFTPECRKLVTGRQYSSATEDSLDQFCQYAALSPVLQPFMGATRVEVGEVTPTPAQPPARGALASFPIVIHGASVLSVQHASGMARGGVASSPPTTHMVMRLEQQRRPPHQACWMVREIMDVRHAFAGDMGNAHVGA